MSFLDLGYEDRFNGDNKTVFRGDDLVYTVNPDNPMAIINDNTWYDRAALQVHVWEHNLEKMHEAGLPLTFDDFEKQMMFYEVEDDRINGQLTAPAIQAEEYEHVEPYPKQATFKDISKEEERQIRWMQEILDDLIEDGEIAVKERELAENDYRGPGCLRQWGRNSEGQVYLLEFGEHHNMLEGPYSGEEFLEEHNIERQNYGVRSPIMLGDMSAYSWESAD